MVNKDSGSPHFIGPYLEFGLKVGLVAIGDLSVPSQRTNLRSRLGIC
jgi:hypothetical protein